MQVIAATMAIAAIAAGCGGGNGADAGDVEAPAVTTDVVVAGLDGPTQLAIGSDGYWYVAQLAGGEDDGVGQVLRLDPDELDADPVVVLDRLDKPTGVAVFADELWVMERRRLTRGPLDGSSRVVAVENMAFNGRSQGALTVAGDRLLFDTSGSSSTPTGPTGDPTTTSGALWSVDRDGVIAQVAFGFKHAYVQTVGADGTVWTVEVSDGRHDGKAAEDEIVAVVPGADHGWPACVGDNRPVAERGATVATCAAVPRSHSVFAPGATPTGLAVAPWDASQLVVALWVEGRIVSVPIESDDGPVAATTLTDDIGRPQHLVTDGDRLLATDHERGQILALTLH